MEDASTIFFTPVSRAASSVLRTPVMFTSSPSAGSCDIGNVSSAASENTPSIPDIASASCGSRSTSPRRMRRRG